MRRTKTSSKAKERYNAKAYRKITLRFRRDGGIYERLLAAAAEENESMNAYIVEAVRRRMDAKERDRA